ncbi:MAG: 4-hydroxy-3-methylbut-2-enyl diphosphate reductase [bacterium]|nr:MAG: 4-hydroxy-3-methylbut-2-enyl diphosphate reductase [bacterium]
MKLLVAQDIGYCYGVKDAIDEVVDASIHSRIDTFGPLIHNSSAIHELTEKHDINTITDIDDLRGNTLAIRAHGIPPKTLKSFLDQGIEIIDTTCPFVRKTQNIARQFMEDGYFVIILGKKKHPEVVGIAGHVEDHCLVVEKEGDLEGLSRKNKIAIVFQSTITVDDVGHLIPKIVERAKEVKIRSTICDITSKRQAEARELARQVDYMIVVGGKNSSNTRKLADICRNEGVKTVQIEYPSELKNLSFEGIEFIGLTTGTSTPQTAIDAIFNEIKEKTQAIAIELKPMV